MNRSAEGVEEGKPSNSFSKASFVATNNDTGSAAVSRGKREKALRIRMGDYFCSVPQQFVAQMKEVTLTTFGCSFVSDGYMARQLR